MNTGSLLPLTNSVPGASTMPAWQLEVNKLRANHVAIELVLRKPNGLSTEAVTQHYALREELIATMEDFLDDLDQTDETPCSPACMASVLRKHANIMKKLNARASYLLRQQQSRLN